MILRQYEANQRARFQLASVCLGAMTAACLYEKSVAKYPVDNHVWECAQRKPALERTAGFFGSVVVSVVRLVGLELVVQILVDNFAFASVHVESMAASAKAGMHAYLHRHVAL